MTATVTVTKSGDTIYFRPSSQPGSSQLAEYLNTLVNRTSAVHKATREQEAKVRKDIEALEKAAAEFERKALDGRYTLAKELQDYYLEKSRSCRREAARLRGSDAK